MRSKMPAMATVCSLAILVATGESFQPGTLIPAASAEEKSDATAAFGKGTVWNGTEVVTKPSKETATYELTVIERQGENYMAQLVSTTNPSYRTRLEGTIAKDGSFTWKAAAGEQSVAAYEGKINGNKIDLKIGDRATCTFTLAPPDVEFGKGSVWKGKEVVTKPKQESLGWELTVIERQGEKYTAHLVSTEKNRLRVEGIIKKDGSFNWKAAASEKQPVAPYEGKINWNKIDLKNTPTGNGVEATCSFLLARKTVVPKPFAVILCKFSDLPKYEPFPTKFYQEAFTEAGAGKGREFDYFRDVSYGQIDMTGSKVFGWFNMPKHSTKDALALQYPADRGTLHDWGVEVAKAHKIDLTPFYGVVVLFNFGTDNGHAGGTRVVIGDVKGEGLNPTFDCHELGHAFGLGHTWFARPDTEYGDAWDIMSAMSVFSFKNSFAENGPGMNAFNLKKLGCMPEDRIWYSNGRAGSQQITLAALNQFDANGYLMASIPPAPDSKSKTSYFVEFRRKTGWDAGIPRDTVLVHEVRENGVCYVLSRNGRKENVPIEVLPGQDFKIPERNLTVKVESFDADASTAKLTITIAK